MPVPAKSPKYPGRILSNIQSVKISTSGQVASLWEVLQDSDFRGISIRYSLMVTSFMANYNLKQRLDGFIWGKTFRGAFPRQPISQQSSCQRASVVKRPAPNTHLKFCQKLLLQKKSLAVLPQPMTNSGWEDEDELQTPTVEEQNFPGPDNKVSPAIPENQIYQCLRLATRDISREIDSICFHPTLIPPTHLMIAPRKF